MTRCDRHDLLPGQCECSWTAPPVDYERNRAIVLRQHGMRDEPPQVTATIVATPTTDVLRRRLGHDIPTIGYGHWGVVVDDSATRDLRREREAARAAAERQALIDALNAPGLRLEATLTIR